MFKRHFQSFVAEFRWAVCELFPVCFQNIANNRGLITLLVDRAEDESLKEAILTYAFILNSRPATVRNKPSSSFTLAQLGMVVVWFFVCFFGFLTSSSATRLSYGGSQDKDRAARTMKYFIASLILLRPVHSVGSGDQTHDLQISSLVL